MVRKLRRKKVKYILHVFDQSRINSYDRQTERPKTYRKGPDVMSKSKRSQQRYAASWIGQTHLDGFFSGSSTQSQQPIIDIDAVSDAESDTVELIDSEAALDQQSTHIIPIIPQSRRTSERDTDSQSDTRSELPEIVT